MRGNRLVSWLMHVIIHELGAVVDGHKLLQFHCQHLEARLMHGDAATKRVLPLEVVLVTRPVLVSMQISSTSGQFVACNTKSAFCTTSDIQAG